MTVSKKNHGKQKLKLFMCQRCGEAFIYPARKCHYCHKCHKIVYQEIQAENKRLQKQNKAKADWNKRAIPALSNIAECNRIAKEKGLSYGQAVSAGVI